jgi:hypothetical protein
VPFQNPKEAAEAMKAWAQGAAQAEGAPPAPSPLVFQDPDQAAAAKLRAYIAQQKEARQAQELAQAPTVQNAGGLPIAASVPQPVANASAPPPMVSGGNGAGGSAAAPVNATARSASGKTLTPQEQEVLDRFNRPQEAPTPAAPRGRLLKDELAPPIAQPEATPDVTLTNHNLSVSGASKSKGMTEAHEKGPNPETTAAVKELALGKDNPTPHTPEKAPIEPTAEVAKVTPRNVLKTFAPPPGANAQKWAAEMAQTPGGLKGIYEKIEAERAAEGLRKVDQGTFAGLSSEDKAYLKDPGRGVGRADLFRQLNSLPMGKERDSLIDTMPIEADRKELLKRMPSGDALAALMKPSRALSLASVRKGVNVEALKNAASVDSPDFQITDAVTKRNEAAQLAYKAKAEANTDREVAASAADRAAQAEATASQQGSLAGLTARQGKVDISQGKIAAGSEASMAAEMEHRAATMEEIYKRQTEEQNAVHEQMKQVTQELVNSNVDTGRYWASKSTGEKIALGILSVLGAAGTYSGGANPVLARIDHAIKMDVDEQIANIGLKGAKLNALQRLYQNVTEQTGSQIAGVAAVSNVRLEALKHDFNRYALLQGTETSKLNALKAIKGIEIEQTKHAEQISAAVNGNVVKRSEEAQKSEQQKGSSTVIKSGQAGQASPHPVLLGQEIKIPASLTKEEDAALRKEVRLLNGEDRMISDARDYLGKHPVSGWRTGAGRVAAQVLDATALKHVFSGQGILAFTDDPALNARLTSLIVAREQRRGQGVLREPEFSRYISQLTSAGSAEEVIDRLSQETQDEGKSIAEAYSLTAPGGPSISKKK